MRKLLFVGILLLSSNAFGLDLSGIRDAVRLRVKDVGVSGQRQRFSDTQYNEMINQTQRDVVNVTWAVRKSSTIVLSTGTTSYAMPSTFITVDRIVFENRNFEEVSVKGLDSRFSNADWRTTGGVPQVYFRDESVPDEIAFYPWPADDQVSTGTVILGYFAIADDMSADNDEPFNGINRLQQYSDLLVYEPVYKIFLIEGQMEKAIEYRQYYEKRLELMVSLEGQRPNFIPGFSSKRQ